MKPSIVGMALAALQWAAPAPGLDVSQGDPQPYFGSAVFTRK